MSVIDREVPPTGEGDTLYDNCNSNKKIIKNNNKNNREKGEKEGEENPKENKDKNREQKSHMSTLEKKILGEKGSKILRIGSQNIRKGINLKTEQLSRMIREVEIDILIIQEWRGWKGEEEREGKRFEGYTAFMSFVTRKGTPRENVSQLVMSKKERVLRVK